MSESGLVKAVKTGNYRASLEALRDRLAVELGDASGSAVAALGKQLADVLRVLDGMTEPEVSVSDDIAAQRAKRRRGADTSDAAGGT